MAIGTHNGPAAAEPVVDSLAGQARERTGLSDLGGDSWREGLTILVDALESTPNVMPAGRDELYGKFIGALSSRSSGSPPGSSSTSMVRPPSRRNSSGCTAHARSSWSLNPYS